MTDPANITKRGDLAGGVTLALLAGGAGSRMGMPKDRVTIHGVPQVQWILARTRWPGPTLLVGPANRQSIFGQELLDRVVWDDAEAQGPVCGVRTALQTSATDELVVLPLDMPGLKGAQLHWLIEHARTTKAACVMLRRGPSEEHIEPFPAYFRTTFLQAACWSGAEKARSMRALARGPTSAILEAPAWPETVWANLNTPQDVAVFERVVPGPDTSND